jgi:hypothetical protein
MAASAMSPFRVRKDHYKASAAHFHSATVQRRAMLGLCSGRGSSISDASSCRERAALFDTRPATLLL